MIKHSSAKPSHYNKEAESYDGFNDDGAKIINSSIEKILKKHKVRTVLDLTCGTGSQVFWLTQKGFEVVGVDINAKMLKIAKQKAVDQKLKLKFLKGDMRNSVVGKFDAVITVFNSIGHLTKQDFEKAIKNVAANLHHGGLYIFDIFNLGYLLSGDNITHLTIDNQAKVGKTFFREIQYSTIDQDGVLASYDIYHQQAGEEKPKISKAFQTLQVYRASELQKLLETHGFEVLQQTDVDGGKFIKTKTERVLTVARKR